jgi:hypothetical protein
MKKFMLLITIVLLLAACTPSHVAVLSGPVETQVSLPASTPTANPTATVLPTVASSPTATSSPCTDFGWTDITKYLTEFRTQENNFASGLPVSEFMQNLKDIKEKIVNVTVDACTEHARQLVVSSCDNRISAMQVLLTGVGDSNAAVNSMMLENQLVDQARLE